MWYKILRELIEFLFISFDMNCLFVQYPKRYGSKILLCRYMDLSIVNINRNKLSLNYQVKVCLF